MTDDLSDQLLTLLAHERSVIRSGALSDLANIAAKKTALTIQLETKRVPAVAMKQILADLHTNAALLTAAHDGVKAAVERLAALRAVRDGLSLYTADGSRQTVARAPTWLEHKA